MKKIKLELQGAEWLQILKAIWNEYEQIKKLTNLRNMVLYDFGHNFLEPKHIDFVSKFSLYPNKTHQLKLKPLYGIFLYEYCLSIPATSLTREIIRQIEPQILAYTKHLPFYRFESLKLLTNGTQTLESAKTGK